MKKKFKILLWASIFFGGVVFLFDEASASVTDTLFGGVESQNAPIYFNKDQVFEGGYLYAVSEVLLGASSPDIITKYSAESTATIWQIALPSPSVASMGGFAGLPLGYRMRGIEADSSGLYIARTGRGGDGYSNWLIEKRSLADGSLIWSQSVSPGPYPDVTTDIKIDSTGVYIIGIYQAIDTGNYSRIEKRSLSDGSLIWGHNLGYSFADKMEIDETGVYISISGNIQKRSLSNGNQIWSAPGSGMLAVDGTGLYYAGGRKNGLYDLEWIYGKLNKSSGGVLWSGNHNAHISTASSPDYYFERPHYITLGSDGLYVGGETWNPHPTRAFRVKKINTSNGSILTDVFDDPNPNHSVSLLYNNATYYTVKPDGACVTLPCYSKLEKRGQATIDNATCIADPVVSPKTTSQSFAANITCANTGTTTWDLAQGYVLKSQNLPNNMTWGINSISFPAGVTTVAPNQQVTFTGNFTSPAVTGTYNYQWQMAKGAAFFGAMTAPQSILIQDCTYSSHACYKSSSIDCGLVSNCGQTGTESAACLAVNSCTGATESRPLSECGASCVSGSAVQCPACSGGLGTGEWKEVAP